MANSLLILGAGGHGRSIYEMALSLDIFSYVNYLDDDSESANKMLKDRILGRIDQLSEFAPRYTHVVVGIGNNSVRETLQIQALNAGFVVPTLIHPKAIVSPSANIEMGTIILSGAIIGANVNIGKGVIVNCQTVVDHDGKLEDFCHLGVGVSLAGNSLIGRSAFVQAGSCGGYNSHIEPYAKCAPGTVLETRA
jgi:sugar O-acyltransferase (sialic acid O-acetyltransferase NeuD family)